MSLIAACPGNFTYERIASSCYYIITDKLPWSAAAHRCTTLHPDAHLIIINSNAEQIVMSTLLSQHPGTADILNIITINLHKLRNSDLSSRIT